MPYKFETDKIPLPRAKDRRVKLSNEQREAIRANPANLSQRQIATMYGVSRRTVQFIQSPEKHGENLMRRQERGGWKQYYDKEKHREAMQDHRRYKAAVLLHTPLK